MQSGFTKYCCFLCLWDSWSVSQHYKQKDWGSRSTFVPGEHSLKENPLVDMNKVHLPPLHILLGLMKNFVKALHKNGAAFQHLSSVFPGLSAAKVKEGLFVGPQIREVLKDIDFEELLNLKELRAWKAFKSDCSGFLGNMMGDFRWMMFLCDIPGPKYTRSKKTQFWLPVVLWIV